MAKIKAGKKEAHNHYCNQARGTVVTSQTGLRQVDLYNQIDEKGHLYGAIIASLSLRHSGTIRESNGKGNTRNTTWRFVATMLATYLSLFTTRFTVRLMKSTMSQLMES
jgi:hypothetical protein